MQHDAGGAGRRSPAQALLGLSASSQDKPSTGVFLLGREGGDKRATLPGYSHPAPLHKPPIATCRGVLETSSSPETQEMAGLPFSLEAKYLRSGILPSPRGYAGRQGRMEPKNQPVAETGLCILPRALGWV